jgi:hypothetical protein
MEGMMTEAKWRPIMMDRSSVNEARTGHKTETRRIIKPLPRFEGSSRYPGEEEDQGMWSIPGYYDRNEGEHMPLRLADHSSPYGRRGDFLWVKEQYAIRCGQNLEPLNESKTLQAEHCIYRADYRHPLEPPYTHNTADGQGNGNFYPKSWHGPMLMPRHLSRFSLRVLGVQAERLQNISLASLRAEGVMMGQPITGMITPEAEKQILRLLFSLRWDNLNAKRGDEYTWEANPWVWAIKFAVVKQGE